MLTGKTFSELVKQMSLVNILGVFTLIHLNAHWTKSHQTALDQFALAPFTL